MSSYIKNLIAWFAERHRRRRELEELSQMNDHLLRDIGLTKMDVRWLQAIELNPKDWLAYNNRASAYFKAGKAAQGLPDAEKSLVLRSNNANTLDTRGRIFEALGRREEAIADFRRALSIDPNLQSSKDGLKRLGATP